MSHLCRLLPLRRPASYPVAATVASSVACSAAARRFSTAPSCQSPRVCIVGSGPAGFYTAQHLLSQGPPDLTIDLVERLPVPFGLVR